MQFGNGYPTVHSFTVLVVEHDQFSSSSHPVGRLCHEAAAELRRLHAQAAQDEALLRQALEALDSDHPDIQLRTAIAMRERLGGKMFGEDKCVT